MGWEVAVHVAEVAEVPVDFREVPPACIEPDGRPKVGVKAKLYCQFCHREECVFRPLTPLEYCLWQHHRLGLLRPRWLTAWVQEERGNGEEGYAVPTLEEAEALILDIFKRGPEILVNIARQIHLPKPAVWKICDRLRTKGILYSRRADTSCTLEWGLC